MDKADEKKKLKNLFHISKENVIMLPFAFDSHGNDPMKVN